MKTIKIKPDKYYIIHAGQVWEGAGSSGLLQNCTVTIKKGRIERVSTGGLKTEINDAQHDAQVIRLPEITLMPGLIDCHVHLAFDSQNLLKTIEEWTTNPAATRSRIKQWMQDSLSSGLVALRDGGDLYGFSLQTREAQKTGQLEGPKILSPGTALYKKGRYGHFLGPGIETLADAKDQIAALAEQKVDHIKIVVSGLVSFKEYGLVGKTQFTAEELRAIVDTAHRYGLPVMAHASSDEAVSTAISAGVDSVEHGYFVKDATLKQMAESQTAWLPTVAPLGNLLTAGHVPYPGANLDVIRRSYEGQLEAINKAVNYGVLLGIGTDAGANQVYHGKSYLDELKYYQKAGLSNEEILSAATSASAKIVGMHEAGHLKPGKLPLFIGVRGNPLQNLNQLKNIEFIAYI